MHFFLNFKALTCTQSISIQRLNQNKGTNRSSGIISNPHQLYPAVVLAICGSDTILTKKNNKTRL